MMSFGCNGLGDLALPYDRLGGQEFFNVCMIDADSVVYNCPLRFHQLTGFPVTDAHFS
jgi:hypothetical protein